MRLCEPGFILLYSLVVFILLVYSLQNDFRKLSDKTDHTIGGLSIIASEYDDFNERINSLSNKNKIFKKDMIRLNELYDKLDKN